MKLPDNFKFGRFRLESYFVLHYNHIRPDIIINGIEMTSCYAEYEKVKDKLSKGESIKVILGNEGPLCLIKIEDKEWVYIEKV